MFSIPKKDWSSINIDEEDDLPSSITEDAFLDKELFDKDENEISCSLTVE